MKYRIILSLLFVFSLALSGKSQNKTNIKSADTLLITQHLTKLSKDFRDRNFYRVEILNKTAEYIKNEMLKSCDSVYYQTFSVNGKEYKNVIGSIGLKYSNRLIIGAHYDVCETQEGADDNASGIAGLLELARIFKENKTNSCRIDFVAYTLEEPPIYGTKQMGSYVHAKYLQENKIKIVGMICLEMIGYFSDEKNSQSYPLPSMKKLYGDKGDFICIVKQMGKNNKFENEFSNAFADNKTIKAVEISAPKTLTGVDFSDHRNYWLLGYGAVMITDTSFYRNKNYHTEEDTMEKLNLQKMKYVIDEVYHSILICGF